MTKAEIVSEIAKSTGIEKLVIEQTVESFMDVVQMSLCKNENVYLRGFGSFVIKKRAKKIARNISNNTSVIVPEHYVPTFKPADVFLDKVK